MDFLSASVIVRKVRRILSLVKVIVMRVYGRVTQTWCEESISFSLYFVKRGERMWR